MCKKILMIEDDEATRLAMMRLLQRHGHEVQAFGSVEQASSVASGTIDIALLDVRLPGRFGDEFGVELRRRHPQLVILFLTAEADIDIIKSKVPGAMVLRKPVDMQVLLELIGCLPSA